MHHQARRVGAGDHGTRQEGTKIPRSSLDQHLQGDAFSRSFNSDKVRI